MAKWGLAPGTGVVLSLCMLMNANAGEDTPQERLTDTVELEDMVITPSRREMLLSETPDFVEVLGREDIEELNPSSVGDLIEYATGVAVETGTGSGLPDRSVISLNGLPPNYTLVLVDGVRLVTEHIHTGQNVDFIPPQSIERIEVMRGSASAQYGSDAIGGIVNIVTRKCGNRFGGSIGSAVSQVTDYRGYEGSLSLFTPAGERVRFSTFLNWEESEGAPLKAPAHRVGHMGYDRMNISTRMDAKLSDSASMYASFNWVHHTIDFRGVWEESHLATPAVGLSCAVSPSVDINANLVYSRWESAISDESNTIFEPEIYAVWRINPRNTFLGGADYRWNEFVRTAVEEKDQDTAGLFVQDEWAANEYFSLTTSLRYDKVYDIEPALSPKASVLITPRKDFRIRASVGCGFHAPTVQERHEEGYGHGGAALRFGNPDLDPEYSTTYTLGFEGEPNERVQVMLYGFYSDIDDMIVPVYEGPWADDPTKDVWRRTNIKDAEVYGGELNLRMKVSRYLRVETGYTRTDNEDRSTGRQLPYRPGASLYLKVVASYHAANRIGITGYAGLRSAYDREAWSWKPEAGAPADDPNGLTTELEDYTKLDAGITVSAADSLRVYVKVENLLAEDIENLDDAYTLFDDKKTLTVGAVYSW